MSYTKGELVLGALEELGIADYEFDTSPEQIVAGMRRLDSMLADWNARGLRVSYPIPSDANGSNSDDDSNLPDLAWEAVITNLAIKLGPSYGKVVSIETKSNAKYAMNTVFSIFAAPPEMQLPSMPRGAGYKQHDYPFTQEAEQRELIPVDNNVDLSGGPTNGA